MNATFLIFQFIVLIFSVMIHEISHGLMAESLGDPTARDAGRITLNPLKHIDLFGSILLPALLLLTHSPVVLGWAKPVPYDPSRLKNPQAAAGKIAAAGPLSNFLLAAVFGVLVRLGIVGNLSDTIIAFFGLVVFLNIGLGIFNLLPIPPLDGSKVLYTIIPPSFRPIMYFLERFGILIIFALLWLGSAFLSLLMMLATKAIIGAKGLLILTSIFR